MIIKIIKILFLVILMTASFSIAGKNEANAQAQTRIFFNNYNPTTWQVHGWYYNANGSLRTTFSRWPQNTFSSGLKQAYIIFNQTPQRGERVRWLTACVDPTTAVNVNYTGGGPGSGVTYDTSINIGCREQTNAIYAGCGSNGDNVNFGNVAWDDFCPTNTDYCTKAGITQYPNLCNRNLRCGGGNNRCDRIEDYCQPSSGTCQTRVVNNLASACVGVNGCCLNNSQCGGAFCGSGGNRCDRRENYCNSSHQCDVRTIQSNSTQCNGVNGCCRNDSHCGSNQYCHNPSPTGECRNYLRISGNVYVDQNRNGSWDGEPQDRGLSGKTVERRNASATSWQQSDTTSGTGGYNFPDLRNPSTHDVRIINSQYDTTCQYTLQSSNPRNNVDATNNNVDFRFTTQQYVISGNVWRDVNNNRVIDSADVRVTNTNIRVRTRDSSGNPTGLNDYINTNGVYRIDGHEHGLTYSAQLLTGTLPNGWSVVGSSTINNITINCADNTGNNFLLTNFTPPPAQPDLTIDSFTVPSGATGTSANAQVTIINDSATGTGAGFNVRFRNGAGATVNVPTGALGANASRTLTIPFTRPATANTYTADVFVDSGNAITEAVETNNTATANYSAGGSSASPNLIVSSFTVPNGPGNTSVNSSVTVANIGGASTGVGFSISVDDGDGNGTPVRVSTSALAAGSSRTITIPITTPVIGGTYNAEATADSTNVIPESNETDNTANDSYIVAAGPPPPPTYSITGGVYYDLDSSLALDGSEDYESGQLQITGSVPPPTSLGSNWPINISSITGSGFTIDDLVAGQYTLSYPVSNIPAGYVATYPSAVIPPPRYVLNLGPSCAPVGPAGNQTVCSAGNQSRVNFGINLPPVDPWYQGIGGDMRSDAALINEIPSGLKFSEVDSNNTSPGVIFGFNLGGNTSEQRVKANSKRWLITGDRFNPSVIKTSYEYIDSIIQKSGSVYRSMSGGPTPACTGSASACTINSNIASGIYRQNGNVTLSGGSTVVFPQNRDFIFLINGNLTINTDILVPTNSTAIFIVSGNITVGSNITDIHGIYSADGNFNVESNSPAPDQTLEVQGSIIANARKNTPASRFLNERDLEFSNFNTPAVQIIFRPDFVLNAPDILRSTTYKVREVAPGQ